MDAGHSDKVSHLKHPYEQITEDNYKMTMVEKDSEKKHPETPSPPPEYEEIEKVDLASLPECVPASGAAANHALAFDLPLLIESLAPPEYTAINLPLNVVTQGDDWPDSDWDESGYDIDKPDGHELTEEGPAWSELSCCKRVEHVLVNYVGKTVGLLTLLYFFICSLDFLSSAFRLLGGKVAGEAFQSSELLQNPITGLMIGILATVLVQSSSTSTSIVVTMVASGIMPVRPAIPIIMGANIGTSVTNTVVSLAQSGDRSEFRRAFAGATVHDMFNWLAVLILLPLEVATGYLYHLTSMIVASYNLETMTGSKLDLLKTLTKPFTQLVIQLDKKIIEAIALGKDEYMDKSLIKQWCVYEDVVELQNVTSTQNLTSQMGEYAMTNVTSLENVTVHVPVEPCTFLFRSTGLSDMWVGLILLFLSLVLLCSCLVLLVKLLHSIMRGHIAKVIKRTLNSDLPGCCGYFTDYLAILVGAGMTILVQSSSVFTSAMTPLVGMGVIKLERMYPLTLGSNIGTTATGLLAAMAASSDKLAPALQIALCHLLFNVSGILLFFPIPKMRFPIPLAKIMGKTTAKYRWFAIFYLIVMFLIIPTIVFSLSMLGVVVMVSIVGTVLFIFLVIVAINVLQKKSPKVLPAKLKNWSFLPEWMHSLDPLDRVIGKVMLIFNCCRCCQNVTKLDDPVVVREAVAAMDCLTVLPPSVGSSQESSPSNSRLSSRSASLLLHKVSHV